MIQVVEASIAELRAAMDRARSALAAAKGTPWAAEVAHRASGLGFTYRRRWLSLLRRPCLETATERRHLRLGS